MRAAALSRLITLMLVVGPAAFAAPLNAPVAVPAPASTVEDAVNQRAPNNVDPPIPNVRDMPVSNVAENSTLPQKEVETNRDAAHVDQQGVSATPKVLGTHNPTLPINVCLIVVGRTPGEVIQTPGGPKVANANGQVFGDCQTVEDQDPTFTPGFINLADSDPNEDNSGDADNGSGNDVSTADEPPASDNSTSSPSDDSDTPSSTDTTPTPDDTQGADGAPSTGGQDSSPASGGDQDQNTPADGEQPQTTAGNQHATQPEGDSFPAGTVEGGVSRLAQATPNGIPPNGIPPNGIPPNGIPPNGVPPNGVAPSVEGAASRASLPFPNGAPSAEQLSSFSPFSNFPPSGNIHAPSAPSYTDAPFDSIAPPAGAIQAAQDVSADAASAPADASSTPFGVVNLADSELPKPAISLNVEVKPLGDDC